MDNRGFIRNLEAFKQAIDPTGMIWCNITGCDIDYFYDFQNKVFVFIELKYMDAEMKLGQRLALERLCDSCQDGGRESILIVARHCEPISNSIRLEFVPVSEYRYKGKWNIPRSQMTVREMMDGFLELNGVTHAYKKLE